MDELRRLANTMGMERLLAVGGIVSGIAIVVLILGWLLIGFWAGLLGALVVLVGFYLSLQNIVGRFSGGTATPYSPTVRVDVGRLQGRHRDYVQSALDRKASIEGAVAAAGDPGVKRALRESTKDLPELVRSIYELSLKSQSVELALRSSGTMQGLIEDTQRLDALIKSTNDDFQRSQYRATLDGKLQQMQNTTDTEVALRRWDAQLENALGTLDTILSQVLRVSSSQVLSYTGDTADDLSNTLKREVEELKATSDAFDSVYGRT